ncbi:MAG: hypothetical protein MRY63_02120 [Neomegalonema sp.]|nr:hypothetical protein [Neomegalonema sp.]
MSLSAPTVPDLVGVVGAICVLYAYWAVSNDRLSAKSATFHAINALGAVLLLFSLLFKPNLGSIVIELVWLTIALFGLYRARHRR